MMQQRILINMLSLICCCNKTEEQSRSITNTFSFKSKSKKLQKEESRIRNSEEDVSILKFERIVAHFFKETADIFC